MHNILSKILTSMIFLSLSTAVFALDTVSRLQALITDATLGSWYLIPPDNSEYKLTFTLTSGADIGSFTLTYTSTVPTTKTATGSWIITKVANKRKFLLGITVTSSTIPGTGTNYTFSIEALGKRLLKLKNLADDGNVRFYKRTSIEEYVPEEDF